MSEHCPHHHHSNEAANRAEIWRELHGAFGVVVSALAEEAHYYPAGGIEPRLVPCEAPAASHPLLNGADGSFAEYVTTGIAMRYDSSDFQPLRLPVGRPGAEFAAQLLASNVRLVTAMEAPVMQKALAEQAAQHETVLRQHTFRGVQSGDAHEALQVSFQQGIVSATHALALLTAETAGDHVDETARQLVEKRQVQRLARRIGSAAVSTLIRRGRYVAGPLTETAELSPAMLRYADTTRQLARAATDERRDQESRLVAGEFDADLHQLAAMGMSCPATKGPVQQLSELLVDGLRT